MQLLTFINSRGQSVNIGNSAPFILQRIEGTGEVDATLQFTRSPFQDGNTLNNVLLENRVIRIEGTICARTQEEMYCLRQTMSSAFNPKLKEGKLRYQNDNGIKEIKSVCEKGVEWKDKFDNGRKQAFILTLISPLPFWLDSFTTSKQMAYLMGGLTFPMRLPTKFAETSFRRVLLNSGDVETPVEIEFHGSAINPIVKNNTTGEFIIVKRILSETDKLIISTEFGNKKVEIVNENGTRTNVFNWIDLNSTFFQLQVGENELEYNSNDENKKSKVIVRYKNRYVGV